MLDRAEAPTIQDGYGISVAYACLMEIIRSIAISIEGAEYFRYVSLFNFFFFYIISHVEKSHIQLFITTWIVKNMKNVTINIIDQCQFLVYI